MCITPVAYAESCHLTHCMALPDATDRCTQHRRSDCIQDSVRRCCPPVCKGTDTEGTIECLTSASTQEEMLTVRHPHLCVQDSFKWAMLEVRHLQTREKTSEFVHLKDMYECIRERGTTASVREVRLHPFEKYDCIRKRGTTASEATSGGEILLSARQLTQLTN